MTGPGDRLRDLRIGSGLTQEELAERSGLSVRAISDIERGRSSRPYLRSLRQLADALRLTPDVSAELLSLGRIESPTLSEGAASHPSVAPESTSPHQLPPTTGRLHGRISEIAALDRWLQTAEGPRVVGMVGPGGVGKTALAVNWAYGIQHRFPDGELYLNLRGFDESATPLSTGAALDTLLRALSVAPALIPDDEQERSALYRSITQERRLLVLLDNARDTVQVRYLLTGPTCLTIVTSRNQLRGLVVREAAHRITVKPLGLDAAAAVFQDATLGKIDCTSRDFRELVERCSGLPLALRIVAERIARDETSLTELVQHMRERSTRLDVMNADDDDQSSVRAILSWSYHALTHEAATAFELLGAFPGTDIGNDAAAALFDSTPTRARQLLDNLITLHLVEHPRSGRYQLHDVLHAYAAELVEASDGVDAAILRVIDWYRRTAAAARNRLLALTESDRRLLLGDVAPVREFVDMRAALAWFDDELDSLTNMISYAAEHDLDQHAADIAWLLWFYFDFRKMLQPWLATHVVGVEAARRAGSTVRVVQLLNGLGMVHVENGQLGDALAYFKEALSLAESISDEFPKSIALSNLANTYERFGNTERALHYGRRAVELAEKAGTPSLMMGLANVSEMLSRMGRHEEAMRQLERAATISSGAVDSRIECQLDYAYAVAFAGLGQHGEAIQRAQRSLSIQRHLGWRNGEAFSLLRIGDSLAAMNFVEQAEQCWRQALEIFVELRASEVDEVRTRIETRHPPILHQDRRYSSDSDS